MKLRLFVWMELFVHFVVFLSANFFSISFHFERQLEALCMLYKHTLGWIEKRSNWKSVDNKPKTKRDKAKRELLKYKAEMRQKKYTWNSFHAKRRERLCFDWITHEVTKRAKYYHNEIGYAHTRYIIYMPLRSYVKLLFYRQIRYNSGTYKHTN